MSYTIYEKCAGSAALTFHLLGSKKSIMPYQGTKWRYRHLITKLLSELGFHGPPSKVYLTDPGPWGRALGIILDKDKRQQLIAKLESWVSLDPYDVYLDLNRLFIPIGDIEFTAEFLFLQRLAFSGKGVGITKGCWNSPGFNKTSAYGKPVDKNFGEIKPMVPALIKVLKHYDLVPAEIISTQAHAGLPLLPLPLEKTIVYIDPPYVNSTKYPNGTMSRDEVIELAIAWHTAGATVMISEQEAIAIPGWNHILLDTSSKNNSSFHSKREEWITYRQ